jgi:hypothetical protein
LGFVSVMHATIRGMGSKSDYRARVEALPAGGPQATQRALTTLEDAATVVLVEGFSDQLAIETLAVRHGHDLRAARVAVLPIGGAHAALHFLRRFGPHGAGLRLAGLCDAGEEPIVRRALERAGLGTELEQAGFFVCRDDLEDELIRALRPDGVEAVLDVEGDLEAFRTFQRQPAWRGRPVERQLRRFMGSAGRRKLRYARLLVDALEPASVPAPLAGLLRRVV